MKKRVLSVALIAVLVVTGMVCAAFTARFADHECAGADCVVCAVLRQMEAWRWSACGKDAQALRVLLPLAALCAVAALADADVFQGTPIGRKVRLND